MLNLKIIELSKKSAQKGSLSKSENKLRISSMEEPKVVLHEFARQSKGSFNIHDRPMANSMYTQVSLGSPKVPLCNQLLPQTSHLLSHTSPSKHKTL
jgi:hypothetical protein